MVRHRRSFTALRAELGCKARNTSRRALLGVAGACALAALTVAPRAHAQAQVSGDFQLQRFDPAAGSHNFLTTRGARMDGKMAWTAGFMANYSYRPYDVKACFGADCTGVVRTTRVVENELTGDLLGALTIIPRLQLGLKIPISWVKGQGINPETGGNSHHGIDAVGAGDPELEVKGRLYGESSAPFVIGLAGFVSGPIGHAFAKGEYIGDTQPSAGGRIIVDGDKGPLSFGVNLGGAYHDKANIGSTNVGSVGLYNAAIGYRVSPVMRVLVDGFGTTRFSSVTGENTFELDGAIQIFPLGSPVTVSLGAGTAPVEGVGAPKVRAFAGLSYSLEKRDRDGDGIDDAADQCPTDKEDIDGYEDKDGCPDPDNDQDGIPDAKDKCPDQPEDQDGFEDGDGCPDPDNDKDGIPDVSDQCPNQAETKNGYKDDDGCPDEADRDNDGVPDSRDKCPDEPEDTDGFQDTDGCPDLDNDNDGIPDSQDECIDEPETKNGYQDEDGCPDDPKTGKAAPKATKKK